MMWRCSGSLVLLSTLVLTCPHIPPTHAVSTFQILSPPELAASPRFAPRPWQRNESGLFHTPALFGSPPYGETLVGNLFAPSQPLNQLGCTPFDLTNEPNWPRKPDPGSLPPGVLPTPLVLLLVRGLCTFKQKVRNAEDAGAAVVIIMNDNPNQGLVYMADDKYEHVQIPSVFILNRDGVLLNQSLAANKTVQLEMSWSFIAPDDQVEWDLWTSARDPDTFAFKKVFGTVEAALGSSTKFTPHYVFLQRTGAMRITDCMNNGKYCVPDPIPIPNPREPLGQDIVRENLRQVCLFRQLRNHTVADVWWNYVAQFEKECSLPSQWATTACGDNIITRLGQNLTEVRLCMDSAPLSSDAVNTHPVIEAEMQAFKDAGNPFLPTVIINDEPYRGTIHCQMPLDIATCPVLRAICSGFIDGTEPDVCHSSSGCDLGVQRDVCGVCGGDGGSCRSSSSGVSIGAVIGIVVGAMVLIGIAIVIYMKRQKKELHDGMDHMLRQYLPMEDNDSINQPEQARTTHA